MPGTTAGRGPEIPFGWNRSWSECPFAAGQNPPPDRPYGTATVEFPSLLLIPRPCAPGVFSHFGPEVQARLSVAATTPPDWVVLAWAHWSLAHQSF